MCVCKKILLLDIEEVCLSLSLWVTHADPEQAGENAPDCFFLPEHSPLSHMTTPDETDL